MKKYLKRNKFYFMICVLLFSTAGIMSVFLASIVQKMVDTSVDKNIIQFYHVMILAVLFIIINFLIYVLRGFFRAKYLKNVMFSLNHDLFKGIFFKTVKEFNQENSSAYLSIFNNDLKIIERNYFDNLLTISADLSQFIICLVAVFSFQFSLAIIVIVINVIAIFAPILFGKVLSKKQMISTQKYSQLNIKIKDFFNSFELIKCFQITHHVIHQFDYVENEYETSMQNYRYDEGIISGFSTLSSLGVSVMTTLISLYFVIINRITIGEMLAITQLVNNIANPLGRLSNEIPLLKSIKPIENKNIEYMFSNNEKLTPYKEGTYDWVRICKDELWFIPLKKDDILNPFVMLSDLKYKHLMLGKDKENKRLIFAVPEKFGKDDLKNASAYGFKDFWKSREENGEVFGYWIKDIY